MVSTHVKKTKHILLVDDEVDILTVTKTVLEILGNFIAESCGTTREALSRIEKVKPDLILLDVMMPDMDGISFLRYLKETQRFADIPVAFLTARTQHDDVERYIEEGAAAVISKPFRPEELVQKVNEVLKQRSGQQAKGSVELTRKIETIRQRFVDQLPAKMQELESLSAKVGSKANSVTLIKELYRLAHSLTGAGGTFNFTTLSITARVFENFLRPLTEKPGELSGDQKKEIARMVALLQESALQPDAEAQIETRPEQPAGGSDSNERRVDKLIYIVEDDELQRSELIEQLRFFGFPVQGFATVRALEHAMRSQTPAVLVADINLVEGPTAGIDEVSRVLYLLKRSPPLVFISVSEDMGTHLRALRAGGRALLIKPFDIGDLVDGIDKLTGQGSDEPYRVLIVEDDSHLAEYYELTLQSAGILTQVATDSMQVMQPIHEFRPDLILLDIYMPNCNGLELATLVRQREAFVSISIVFLSTEAGIETQFEGRSIGAEDYLIKPIQADHLVSALLPRLKRSRTLRDLSERDSLTGLLNHTKIKEHLHLQTKLFERDPQAFFVFAMIDIDHFKQVNDTYGHAVGDRILKSLSRLLKQRLRKNDIIGRYGGEEFAVIMKTAHPEQAVKIFDEIRSSFGKVRHQSAKGEFFVTFSCGLAACPGFFNSIAISEAADKALYEAKHAGRDRVVLAEVGGS